MNLFFLTAEMVILINHKVILQHSADELSGVKDHALLDSALKRPQQSLFGEDTYPKIHDKAAALLESLAQNHAFHNGNNRTALMCTAVYFRYNGYHLRFSSAQAEEDFVMDVVKQRYTLKEISEILEGITKNAIITKSAFYCAREARQSAVIRIPSCFQMLPVSPTSLTI